MQPLWPPAATPIVGKNGQITREWLMFFNTLAAVGPTAAITQLTGDVTATGPGSVAASIAPGVIVDADVNPAAAIAWTKLSKAGSSLADLTTRDAGDLSSGTLPYTRIAAYHPEQSLFQDITATSNAGTSPTTVFTHTIAANQLAADGDALLVRVYGTYAANANTKTVVIVFAGTTVQQLGPGAINGGTWYLDFLVMRISATQCRVRNLGNSNTPGGTVVTFSQDLAPFAVNWSSAQAWDVVLTSGTGSNDVTAQAQTISFRPAA